MVESSKQKKQASKAVDKGKTSLRPKENTAGGTIDLRADNPRKWGKHYGKVRGKMGNLEPSEHIRSLLFASRIRLFSVSFPMKFCYTKLTALSPSSC